MRRTLPREQRRGLALMSVVIALALTSVMLGATTWQILAHRRTLERRLNQTQALWLARAGSERAAARLLAAPAVPADESVELIAGSQLRITVRAAPGQTDTFEVICEARYPVDAPNTVVRSVTRRFRRVVEDKRTRLTVVTPEGAAP